MCLFEGGEESAFHGGLPWKCSLSEKINCLCTAPHNFLFHPLPFVIFTTLSSSGHSLFAPE